jgi:hypothetical protein
MKAASQVITTQYFENKELSDVEWYTHIDRNGRTIPQVFIPIYKTKNIEVSIINLTFEYKSISRDVLIKYTATLKSKKRKK